MTYKMTKRDIELQKLYAKKGITVPDSFFQEHNDNMQEFFKSISEVQPIPFIGSHARKMNEKT